MRYTLTSRDFRISRVVMQAHTLLFLGVHAGILALPHTKSRCS